MARNRTSPSDRIAYDYYDVDVPEELGDDEERGEIAIQEAREQARLYCLPCEWEVIGWNGDTIRVRRKRRAPKHRQ